MALPVTVDSVVSAARDAAIASLHQLLRDRLSTATPVREQHGKDASYHPCLPPDAVAFAQSTAEVSEIVKICARHKVPIIPFGSGTGLEGHVVALRGGVCIDISRMNQILQVSAGDLDATVQAGLPASNSMSICAIPACSFRSIQGPMRPSAGWPRRAPPAPRRSATARCGKTSCHSPSSWRMGALSGRRAERGNPRRAMT
jgi:hypothetical protein